MLRIIPLFLLMVTLLTGCNSTETSANAAKVAESTVPTIAVIDSARIFRDSEPGKAGVEFLKKIQTEMQEELGELQAKIQADPENVTLQQEAQAIFAQLQQRMGAEEQNVVNLLNDLVQRTLDEYRAAKKIPVIVGTETALSYDKSADVTTDIIEAINKHQIVYKSIMPEAPKQEAKPAEAAKEATPATEKAPAAEKAPAQEEKK